MAPALPRYTPAIDLGARLAALLPGDAGAARAAFLAGLGVEGWRQAVLLAGARYGLAAYFLELAACDARRLVLVSGQVCPVVPNTLVELGFRPVFVDVDETCPMPGAEQMTQALAAAGGARSVAAVIVSPCYGYLPRGVDELADELEGIRLVLDLAQGALLASRMPRLMARADAAVFSFGVGKGLDVGGGLLAVREESLAIAPARGGPALTPFARLPAVMALRIAIALGLYRHLIPMLDRAIAADKAETVTLAASSARALPSRTFACYAARLSRFAGEVDVARQRAAALYRGTTMARHALWPDLFASADQMHLRQIVRIAEPERRAAVLSALRDAGIDALPAGEPLPGLYLAESTFSVAETSAGLPNAQRFLADAIRLPFLGRVDEPSFDRLAAALEQAFA